MLEKVNAQKKLANQYKGDNVRLKTKNTQLQKEITNNEKVIESIMRQYGH